MADHMRKLVRHYLQFMTWTEQEKEEQRHWVNTAVSQIYPPVYDGGASGSYSLKEAIRKLRHALRGDTYADDVLFKPPGYRPYGDTKELLKVTNYYRDKCSQSERTEIIHEYLRYLIASPFHGMGHIYQDYYPGKYAAAVFGLCLRDADRAERLSQIAREEAVKQYAEFLLLQLRRRKPAPVKAESEHADVGAVIAEINQIRDDAMRKLNNLGF